MDVTASTRRPPGASPIFLDVFRLGSVGVGRLNHRSIGKSCVARCVAIQAVGTFTTGSRLDISEENNAGITGTPSFLLGETQPDGSVKVLKLVRGAQPFANFESVITELLPKDQPGKNGE